MTSDQKNYAITKLFSLSVLSILICVGVGSSALSIAAEPAENSAEFNLDYQNACWTSSTEEPSACAHSNTYDFGQLDTLSVPDGFYDVSFITYDKQFAEQMGLPVDRISILDPPQDKLLMVGFSVKTIGTKTECGLSLALSDAADLKLPGKTWYRTRMVRRGLLAVDQRRLNSETFDLTTKSEELFGPYPDPRARGAFLAAGSEEGDASPDFELGVYLAGANYDIASGLAFFEFEVPCRPFAISAPFLVEQHEPVSIVVQRVAPVDPSTPKVRGARPDINYYQTYEIPLTMLAAALPILEVVATGDERRMRTGMRGKVQFSEPITYSLN